jgi:DNA polymerase II large subunit
MNCAESLLAATQYLDELLEKLYGLPPFYNCKNISDLIGHLGMGIAPHTSGSIVCRICGGERSLWTSVFPCGQEKKL